MGSNAHWVSRIGPNDVMELWWEEGPLDYSSWFLDADDLKGEEIGFGNKAEAAFAGLVDAVRDSEILATVIEIINEEPEPRRYPESYLDQRHRIRLLLNVVDYKKKRRK